LGGVVIGCLLLGSDALCADSVPFESVDLALQASAWQVVPCGYEDCLGDGLSERTALLGDLGGLRTSLGESGIRFDASSTLYYQGVVRGGIDEAVQFGGRNDYYLTMDAHKLGLWNGLLIDLHGETRYGESVNGQAGTLSPPNLGLLFPLQDETITALTQVKFTQILSENLAVFAGKINLVDGYLNPFAAGKGQTQFVNTAFCIPPILGRPLSAYSTLGAGFAVMRGPEPIFTMMVIDPVNNPTTSGFEQFFENGVALFGEVNIPVTIAGRPGHQDFYFAWSNRSVTALDDAVFVDTPDGPAVLFAEVSNSWMLMYAFDQYLLVDPCNPQRGWGVFGQFAISDGNPNPIRWSATVGVGGSSPLSSRPLDTFGVGYYFFQTSTELKDTLAPVLPVGNEQGVELYYNVAVTPWCHVTPNVQVLEPSNQAANTATLIGIRTRIDY